MCGGGGDREEEEQGRQGWITEYFLGPSSPGLSDKSWGGAGYFVGRRRLLLGRGSRKDAVGMSVAEKVACLGSSVAGLDPSALMTQSVTLSPSWNWPAH